MSPRNLVWIIVPVALSAGVIWMSAQDNKTPPDGVKLGELAESVTAREKAVAQKEPELVQMEERLNTLQATLAQEQEKLVEKEKALEEQKAKIEADQKSEAERISQIEKTLQADQVTELEKIKDEWSRIRTVTTVDAQLVKTFEAMQPNNASLALQELAKINFDVAVGLLAVMSPKKAARVMDQVVLLPDVKLAGDLSERLGMKKKEEGNNNPR